MNRRLGVLFGLAAAVSLALGAAAALQLPGAPPADGVVTLALPWAGALGYGLLAIAARAPWPSILCAGLAAFVFGHAYLVAHMLKSGRICPGCLVAAALPAAAAVLRARASRPERLIVATSLALGTLSAWTAPFDHLEDVATRALWPARQLERLPAFVDRTELADCGHGRPVKLLIFEKDCRG